MKLINTGTTKVSDGVYSAYIQIIDRNFYLRDVKTLKEAKNQVQQIRQKLELFNKELFDERAEALLKCASENLKLKAYIRNTSPWDETETTG